MYPVDILTCALESAARFRHVMNACSALSPIAQFAGMAPHLDVLKQGSRPQLDCIGVLFLVLVFFFLL